MTFGEFLRLKRKKKHFSIVNMAAELGISASYLSSLESGYRCPPALKTLEKIAEVLELKTDERYQLFDLAARCKYPPIIADDLIAYIYKTPQIIPLLRYTMKCDLVENDWENILKFIKQNYFY